MQLMGCDVSKATLDVAWFDEAAGRWHQKSGICNAPAGHRQLLRWMQTCCQTAAEDLCLVLEATGVYHRPLAEFAYRHGVRVIVVNPGRAAEHAKSNNCLNKHDQLDARNLQRYGAQLDQAHDYQPESPQIQALQALLSRLQQLDKDVQRERNRLEKCAYIAQSQALAASIRRQIKRLSQEKHRIQKAIDALIAEHAELDHQQQLLQTIKGIGPVTSQWLLPLLYRQRFDSPRQLAAFLGLTPVHKSSGTSLKKRGQLSGRGNRYLRARLYMPAVSASSHDPAHRAFYNTLIGRGKTRKQALSAIMRKLVHTAYGVIKNNCPYQPATTA